VTRHDAPHGDPYRPGFDLHALAPETLAAYQQHRFRATFSVALTVLIHVLTLGLLAPILVARKHAFLPRVQRDDPSGGRAYGFLLVPFYNLYWAFVLFRRLVDRLTLQRRLWSQPGAPSKGLATASAALHCLGMIPYLGLVFWLVSYVAVLPIYLAQVQATCNGLALEAAPPEARSAMRRLERAMLLRWLGWVLLAPSALILLASVAATLFNPAAPPASPVAWTLLLGLVIAGGALWYAGRRQRADAQSTLVTTAPEFAAGYLRIDKNAGWMVAGIALPIGLLFLAVGGMIVLDPGGESVSSAIPVLVFAGLLLLAGAYAVARSLQIRRRISWMKITAPLPRPTLSS
jgi:hypothetical protein